MPANRGGSGSKGLRSSAGKHLRFLESGVLRDGEQGGPARFWRHEIARVTSGAKGPRTTEMCTASYLHVVIQTKYKRRPSLGEMNKGGTERDGEQTGPLLAGPHDLASSRAVGATKVKPSK